MKENDSMKHCKATWTGVAVTSRLILLSRAVIYPITPDNGGQTKVQTWTHEVGVGAGLTPLLYIIFGDGATEHQPRKAESDDGR